MRVWGNSSELRGPTGEWGGARCRHGPASAALAAVAVLLATLLLAASPARAGYTMTLSGEDLTAVADASHSSDYADDLVQIGERTPYPGLPESDPRRWVFWPVTGVDPDLLDGDPSDENCRYFNHNFGPGGSDGGKCLFVASLDVTGGPDGDRVDAYTGYDQSRAVTVTASLAGGDDSVDLGSNLTGSHDLAGGAGHDRLELGEGSWNVDLQANSVSGPQSVAISSFEDLFLDWADSGTPTSSASGTDAANEIEIYSGNGTIEGRAGDDDLTVDEGEGSVYGGFGDDSITVGFFSDPGQTQYVEGGEGKDTIHAYGEDITTAHGGPGNDTVFADSQGVNTATGGAGDDHISLHNFSGVGGSASGGPGKDSIFGAKGPDQLDGGTGAGDTVYGFGGGDTITVDPAATGATLIGDLDEPSSQPSDDPGADTITGSDSADTINGGGLADTIKAKGGDDVIRGDNLTTDPTWDPPGGDDIDAGAGDDQVAGGPGDDQIKGGAGNDTIYGGPGDDTIDCGPGVDAVPDAEPGDTLIDCDSTLVVNETGDEADDDPSDGSCDHDPGTEGEQCTLRAAIEEANGRAQAQQAQAAPAAPAAAPAPDEKIHFDIPGGGVPTIAVDGELPAVATPVAIDGTTQPASGQVELTMSAGAGPGAVDGLTLEGGSSVVKGMVVNGFSGNGIVLSGGDGSDVYGNVLGARPDGGCANPCSLGNDGSGVRIDSADNVVGRANAWTLDEGGHPVFSTRGGEPNVIANSGNDAISIVSGTRNDVADNTMVASGDLPIDLGDDGPTPNDLGDGDSGPNALLNRPLTYGDATTEFPDHRLKGRALIVAAPHTAYLLRLYGMLGDCTDPTAVDADEIVSSFSDDPTDARGMRLSGAGDPAPLGSTHAVFALVDQDGNTSELSNCTKDDDEDGLGDFLERDGVDLYGSSDPEVPLPAMGASPDHKDVFIEIDAAPNARFDDHAAIDRVRDAFAEAPVANADGRDGIRLHVDNGRNSRLGPGGRTWGSLSQADELPGVRDVDITVKNEFEESNWDAFDAIKDEHFALEREPFFRYVVAAHEIVDQINGPGTLGIARGLPGSDILLGIGALCPEQTPDCPGPVDAQAGGFMHELGHTLGLGHGGTVGGEPEHTLFKPNHLSVMNYFFTPGTFDADGPYGDTPILDYSRTGPPSDPGTRGSVAILDENDLSEPVGLQGANGAQGMKSLYHCPRTNPDREAAPFPELRLIESTVSPVDWDCDGDTTSTSVANDTTDDTVFTELLPNREWDALELRGGSVGGRFGVSTTLATDIPEQAIVPARRMLEDDAEPPQVTLSVAGPPNEDATVTVEATDDGQLDSLVVSVDGESKTIDATSDGGGNGTPNLGHVTHELTVKKGTESTIEAFAYDRAFRRSTVASETVDRLPPETAITSGPANGSRIRDQRPSFGFRASEPAGFQCSLDGAGFSACASPLRVGPLADGPHSFRVRAIDEALNVDASAARRDFEVAHDTEVTNPKLKAKRKQKQHGKRIKVKLKAGAAEQVVAVAKGKVKVKGGKRRRHGRHRRAATAKSKTYKLKTARAQVPAGAKKTLKLAPKKSKDAKRIAKALKQGAKVKAKLVVKLSDEAGNTAKLKKTVKLK